LDAVIKDKSVIKELRESWGTVISTKNTIKANHVWAFAGGGYTSKTFRDLSYNLTLLFAFSVVENALLQLRDEGMFSSKFSQLSALMKNSKYKIPWVDYLLIDEARNKRNAIAHKREWIGLELCLSYLDAIEAELVGWGVL
jgi:hypothetical protein